MKSMLYFLLCSFIFALSSIHAEPDNFQIASAVQRGGTVWVYNCKGNVLTSVSVGSKSNDGLIGFTSSTVSIRRGGTIWVYNNKGNVVSSISAGN